MKKSLLAIALSLASLTASAGPVSNVTTSDLTRGTMEFVPTAAGGVYVGSTFIGASIGGMNAKFKDDLLLMFCVDLFSVAAAQGTAVKYDKVDYVTSLNQYANISKVFAFNGGVSSASASDSAAMQLAIWNLVYDTDLDVSSGVFRTQYVGGTDVVTKANALLVGANALFSATDNLGRSWEVSLLSDNQYAAGGKSGYQDYVTATPSKVSEPGTIALTLAGLGGILVFTRRKLT